MLTRIGWSAFTDWSSTLCPPLCLSRWGMARRIKSKSSLDELADCQWSSTNRTGHEILQCMFAPDFLFTLHLLHLFGHHHKVKPICAGAPWLSLPVMTHEICPTPAAQLLRVHVDLFSQTCLQLVAGAGIRMVHWKKIYPELKWLRVQNF